MYAKLRDFLGEVVKAYAEDAFATSPAHDTRPFSHQLILRSQSDAWWKIHSAQCYICLFYYSTRTFKSVYNEISIFYVLSYGPVRGHSTLYL